MNDICACSIAAGLGNSKFAREGEGDGNVAERCKGLALRGVVGRAFDSDGTEGKSEKVVDLTGEGTVARRTGSRRVGLSPLSVD